VHVGKAGALEGFLRENAGVGDFDARAGMVP
jgi:hypothetical protein